MSYFMWREHKVIGFSFQLVWIFVPLLWKWIYLQNYTGHLLVPDLVSLPAGSGLKSTISHQKYIWLWLLDLFPFLSHFPVLKYKKNMKISITLKNSIFFFTSLLLYTLMYVQIFKYEYTESTYASFEQSTGLCWQMCT